MSGRMATIRHPPSYNLQTKNQIKNNFIWEKTINKTYLLLNFASSSSSYFLSFFSVSFFFCFFLNLE